MIFTVTVPSLRSHGRTVKLRAPDLCIGSSAAINSLRAVIDRVADARSRVLICGPAGAGKEVIARLLHAKSSRADQPFIVVSAATISPDRMEEELFGVEGDGGRPRSIGLMERAHGGTLMFDEVGDMPLETQGKILRVLVDQRFRRVRGDMPVSVDVRIISTTSRDLLADSSEGRFREDLYHRLNVVQILAPSLSERREDIPALAAFYIDRISRASGIPKRGLTPETLAALQAYHWPGNVRQLRNVIERTLILMGRDAHLEITSEHLPAEIIDAGLTIPAGEGLEQIIALPLREARERFEREYLIAQINRFGGNISRTAAFIGMERSALHRKLKALGVGGAARVESA